MLPVNQEVFLRQPVQQPMSAEQLNNAKQAMEDALKQMHVIPEGSSIPWNDPVRLELFTKKLQEYVASFPSPESSTKALDSMIRNLKG